MTAPELNLEFLGLPASGKSTLSHMVAGVLRRHGVRVSEPTYITDHVMSDRTRYLHKLRRVAVELVHRPGPARQALGLVVRSHQRRGLETFLSTVNWLFIRSVTEGPGAAT